MLVLLAPGGAVSHGGDTGERRKSRVNELSRHAEWSCDFRTRADVAEVRYRADLADSHNQQAAHGYMPDGYVSGGSPSTSTGMWSASTPDVSSMWMNAS